MSRKISLPLHGPLLDLVSPPTVDAVRARLGGRASSRSHDRVGEVVRLGGSVPPRLGVLLADDGDVVDVIVDRGTVRRTAGREASPWVGEVPDELRGVAAEARAFGALREGASVTFAVGDRPAEPGTLLEKCRWGALVLRTDGAVVGVGFRRVRAPRIAPSPD